MWRTDLLFIGLELMAISTYILVGFLRRDRRSNEAALKYLLLGAFSSGIFAYGLSLLYGLAGSTNLQQISAALAKATAPGRVQVGVHGALGDAESGGDLPGPHPVLPPRVRTHAWPDSHRS